MSMTTTTFDASIESVVLFAINTGELYQEHLRLARIAADTPQWMYHVRHKVLPMHRAKVTDPKVFGANKIVRTARRLKAYYEEHVKEVV